MELKTRTEYKNKDELLEMLNTSVAHVRWSFKQIVDIQKEQTA